MNWLKRKPTAPAVLAGMRAALFADAPLASAGEPETDDPDTPGARFHAALASLQVGDRSRAKAHLLSLLDLAGSDTALTLQVFACLRQLGETVPPGLASQVLGVVVEFGFGDDGTDTIAAYADRSARVLDHRGQALVWKEPDGPIDAQIAAMLGAAQELVLRTRPGPRPEPPVERQAGIAVLTCGGIHAVQGELALLERDALCSPVLRRARQLCEDIVARHQYAQEG